MDLYAYSQIDKLEKIAKENNIEVPRLRGYRLMSEEEKVSDETIAKEKKLCEVYVLKDLCSAYPNWSLNPMYYCSDGRADYLYDKYCIKEYTEEGRHNYVGIKWNRIHGKKRKILKFAIKKQKQAIQEQYDMWNKYVGRDDVLYIHARIGGGNWSYFNGDEITKQSWFLGKVDDYFDCTYCDIYAKINKIE